MNKPIYLDYNATTPLDAEVKEAMLPFLDNDFGNPSSQHYYGTRARKAVEMAREQVAGLLNCFPDEIVFTSGGTESNNYAIKGSALQNRMKGSHIITSSIEHPAVSEVCRFLETEGFRVTYLAVDQYGMVNPQELEKAITPETILISVMHANNEVGTIQPIEELTGIAKEHGIIFHTDAAQSAGKTVIDVGKMGVDLLSLAGHKFYAPKGVGALFIRRGTKLQKLMHGADHEHNMRAGTENVLQIVGLGKAAEIAHRDLESVTLKMRQTRDQLYSLLESGLNSIKLNGHPESRLPNTLSVSFPLVEANTLLTAMEEIAASAGAACHGKEVDISRVLTAMEVPVDYAMGTIRFSTGRYTSSHDIEKSAQIIIDTVKKLNPGYGEAQYSGSAGETVRLTRYTHGMGCACKIRPQYLEEILKDMPVSLNKNVLISSVNSDDAAVYKINNDTAIVQSVDFFTPVVDDPYDFGSIAAANALSDIYAMGAKPLFGLNIAGFPSNRLPAEALKSILRGASDKCREAGIEILGGHTIEDTEPKFGMVITGTIHPGKVISNAGMKPGDILVITKPLGTGIISTAVKQGLASGNSSADAVDVMKSLNAGASGLMNKFAVNACTDITGFGLMGHLKEMVIASGTNVEIDSGKVPLIDGTFELAAAGSIPGGTRNNLEFIEDIAEWSEGITDLMKLILCDAQTSGGLLISIPEDSVDEFLIRLQKDHNTTGVSIGRVKGYESRKITVR